MSRPYGEASVVEENFTPSVDTTHTEAKWREYAKQNIFVKKKANSTHGSGDGLIEIEPCSADTDVPCGIIRSVVGTVEGIQKFTASVAVKGFRCNLAGAGTGALAATDFGKRVKPDANGKATIVDTGGFGRVAGGTKANLVYRFDFTDNAY